MPTKFSLSTTETKIVNKHTVRRIIYADGTKGGWLEREDNLKDNARVDDEACVYDKACVSGGAQVFGGARISDEARIFGGAWVFGKACVFGNAQVFGDALIFDKARVSGKALISGNACVLDSAWVGDEARVFGDTRIFGNARIFDDVHVPDKKQGSDHTPGNDDISGLQARAHAMAVEKGFWPDRSISCIPEKLCLIHSEISEALEAYRAGRMNTVNSGKPEGFGIELADAFLRILDLCGGLNINLRDCIEQKMQFNATRPHKHGGKKA